MTNPSIPRASEPAPPGDLEPLGTAWLAQLFPPKPADQQVDDHPGGVGLILAALAAGVAIDLALHRPPSVATAVAIAVTSVGLLMSGRLKTRASRVLVAGAPIFGVWAAIRVSPWLLPLDLLAAIGMLGLGAALAREGRMGALGLRSLLHHSSSFASHVVEAPGFALRSSQAGGRIGSRERLRSVLAGLAVAAPIVALLGALLASADDVFASLFLGGDRLVSLPPHVVITLAGAILVLGLFRSSGVHQPHTLRTYRWLGATEATVILGAVIALYLLFALSQAVGALAGAERVTGNLQATKEWARSAFSSCSGLPDLPWCS